MADESERKQRIIGVVVLLVLVPLVWLLVRALVPSETPSFENPNFLEAVFASRLVITVVRISILFGVFYLVVSIVALVARRQWLSRVGPVQVAESVRAIEEERDRLEGALRDALQSYQELEQERDRLAEALREAVAYIEGREAP
ncbi:MAG: hypothetical protein M3N31_00695 [Actinomycetota bacterium]|nr:hypothetical protein [Actinomycetota bacterium]